LAYGSRTQDITATEVIEKVQAKYKDIDDAYVKFAQTVKFKISAAEQTYVGTMYLKKKNKYRIETDQQIFVTNGETSWAYSPFNKQVVIDNYHEDKSSLSPEKFLFDYPSDYYSTLLGKDKAGAYMLKLTPKDDNSFVKTMRVWIDSDEWVIKKVEVTDMNETVTTYSVKDLKLNHGVGDDKFTFVVPKNVQVVDLR
jgi:outer membrane lipoprotein carrier protein